MTITPEELNRRIAESIESFMSLPSAPRRELGPSPQRCWINETRAVGVFEWHPRNMLDPEMTILLLRKLADPWFVSISTYDNGRAQCAYQANDENGLPLWLPIRDSLAEAVVHAYALAFQLVKEQELGCK